MNDLISRQAAIAEFSCCELTPDGGIDVNYAIEFLKSLPAAQPKRTQERTETHACDCISRQQAIDAICAVCGNDCDKSEFVYNAPQDEQVILCPEHYCLCTLPSAQPHITHCAECIHWQHSSVRKSYCEVFDWMNKAEDFCSFAERKDGD